MLRVPLGQGEFACYAADLVLVEAWNQFPAQFDVSAPVASLFIIVRCREDGDHLQHKSFYLCGFTHFRGTDLRECVPSHLPAVAELVPLLLALM